MAALNRLTARKVQSLEAPGRHADGGGLYLVIGPGESKRWVLFYRFGSRRREMGLGSAAAVTLAQAREAASKARDQVKAGVDPLETKRAGPSPVAAPVTFADVALAYMADRETAWRNPKHRAQWRQTLEVQAAALWGKPVAAIGTDDVLEVLRPIWQAKPETARRTRGRIERILDAARAGGHCSAENPARLRGHLDVLLPKSRKLTRGHHAAMPYLEVPAFFAELEAREAPAARAMRYIILTAGRTNEILGMVASEAALPFATWTVPGERMKGGRDHRVPLTEHMLEILDEAGIRDLAADDLVFPSINGKKMSDMAFAMLLRRAGRGHYTTHGFRSSFRDWVAEETEFTGDLAEAALAHLTGDETERAYRRGDALARRRHLMEAWCDFVTGSAGAVSSTRSISR